MNNLPHELIAIIGAYLRPKLRMKLYICCKIWYQYCYLTTIDFFVWYKRIIIINADITAIKYDIMNINYCKTISRRQISRKCAPVYTLCMSLYKSKISICNRKFKYVDKGKYITREVHRLSDLYKYKELCALYYVRYMRTYTQRYTLYIIIPTIIKYISRIDVDNLIAAYNFLFMIKYNPEMSYKLFHYWWYGTLRDRVYS